MYKILLINNSNGQKFEKSFTSLFMAEKFVNKCKRGKRLTVYGWFREN